MQLVLDSVPPQRAVGVDDILRLGGYPVDVSHRNSLYRAVRKLKYRGFSVRGMVTRDPLPKSTGGDLVEALAGGVSPRPGTLEWHQRVVSLPLLVVPDGRQLACCPNCCVELFVAEPSRGRWSELPSMRVRYRRSTA